MQPGHVCVLTAPCQLRGPGCAAGHALDAAVQLWLQRAPADNPTTQHMTKQQQQQYSAPVPAEATASSALSHSSSGSSGSSGPEQACASSALTYRLAERLSSASQPLYLQLLLPVAQHRSGISFLVGLRGDLLGLLRGRPAAELGQEGVGLRALDQHLR